MSLERVKERAGITQPPQPGTASKALTFTELIESHKRQIALALPKHLNADRMARIALTEFSKNPDLKKCTPTSIFASIIIASQMGLEPGVGGQGYLIPYRDVCTFVPGWRGLVDLVSRAGRASVHTGAVRATDDFEYELGTRPFLRHVPDPEDDGSPFTYVYAVGWVRNSDWPIFEVWSRKKVVRHLDQYNKVGAKHYAKQNENNLEMYGRKVALLQVLKYMPQSVELQAAIDVNHASEKGREVTVPEAIDGFLSLPEPPPTEAGPEEISEKLAEMFRLNSTTETEQKALLADYAGRHEELIAKLAAQL